MSDIEENSAAIAGCLAVLFRLGVIVVLAVVAWHFISKVW